MAPIEKGTDKVTGILAGKVRIVGKAPLNIYSINCFEVDF